MLPEFSGESYQVVWWFMVGLYVVIAVIVTLLGVPNGSHEHSSAPDR